MSETQLPPTPSGVRGGNKTVKGATERDERIEILDPSPPIDPTTAHTRGVQIVGRPGEFQVQRPSAEVIASAVSGDHAPEAKPGETPAVVQYFRYSGSTERKLKVSAGAGRDGYMATIRPGKILSTKDYALAQLKTQGFLPGRNLEEITAEEALAS